MTPHDAAPSLFADVHVLHIFLFPYKICVIFANHDGEMAVEELAIDYVSELLSTIWP